MESPESRLRQIFGENLDEKGYLIGFVRKELEHKLVERWPKWFNTTGDVRHTLMPFGFQHEDGWFEILLRLCEDLEPRVC